MPPERIAGVLLAAGLSSRMGRNKLLLEIAGRTVVRRAAEKALSAGLSPLLVVVGHEREKVEAALLGLPLRAVFNPDYASGMNSSLRAGIAAVPDDCAGALVLLADMPLVTAGMLGELRDTFRRKGTPLVISTYGGIVAPPTLYGRALFPELRELSGEACGKRVVKQHRAEAAEIAWPPAALADLDLPADVERVRATFEEA